VSTSQITRPQVFVSSVYREPSVPGSEKHLAIRRMIRDLAADLDIDAWIAEYKGLTGGHWTEIVDACIDNLLASQVFIAILYRRGGNPMPLDPGYGFGTTSFFEIELFYASLRLIPAYFFVVRDYEPEPELENLIRILRLNESGNNWFVGTEADVENRIRELLAAIAGNRPLPATLPNFCDLTSAYKSFRPIEQEIHSERLSLIDRFAPVDAGDYALDRIDYLLSESEQAPSRSAQFSRLWIALRELSKRRFDSLDSSSAAQWLRVARRLPSIGSWLGLNGPLNVGVLAAYHTQNELRRRGALDGELFPYGAFASESYSVGNNHAQPGWKRRRFRAAERLASRHAQLHAHDPSGALAIRGNARLQLARLGRPWLVWSALNDFKRACLIRERRGATPSQMGEALFDRAIAEFAVSNVLRFRRTSVLAMMREAVGYMEADRSPGRVGFLVSAKRKFADALEKAGETGEAEAQRESALALARQFGIISQLSRLQKAGRAREVETAN
jgi:hypothetical protein